MPDKKPTVYSLLRRKYPEMECVLLSEVSDSTGSRNQSCDHMVINLWASRGYSIIGFEVKSFRSDWLRELKNPAKQEAIFKYCDYFYLLTDNENVSKLEEIPANWGWMEVRGSVLKTMKQAPKLSPIPLPRQFVCAMLRRAADKTKFVHVDSIEDRINEAVEHKSTYGTKRLENELSGYKQMEERVKEFEKASGIDLSSDWQFRDGKKIGEIVKMIMNNGLDFQQKKMLDLKETCAGIMNYLNIHLKYIEDDKKENRQLHLDQHTPTGG